MIDSNRIPHLMKYMGSKREILEFITSSIQELNIESEWFCDLFSGTSIVGAALRDEFNILSVTFPICVSYPFLGQSLIRLLN